MDPVYNPEEDPAAKAGRGGKAGPNAQHVFGAWKQQGDRDRAERYMRAHDTGLMAEMKLLDGLMLAADNATGKDHEVTRGYGSVMPRPHNVAYLDEKVISLIVQPGDLHVLPL